MEPYPMRFCSRCGAAAPTVVGSGAWCGACGSSFVFVPAGDTQPAHWTAGMQLVPYRVTDAQLGGLEVCRILLPGHWTAAADYRWLPERPGLPVSLQLTLSAPDHRTVLSLLPAEAFYWNTMPFFALTAAVGSSWFGREIRPLLTAEQALMQVIVPRRRALTAALPATLHALPALQRRYQLPTGALFDEQGAAVTLNWPDGTQEELSTLVRAIPSADGQLLWETDQTFGLRCPEGEPALPLLRTLMASLRFNPQWFNQVVQISDRMVQQQIVHIQQIGLLSREISRVSQQISDTVRRGYQERQASLDRASRRFSEAMRGVNSYYDPHKGYDVELPGGYRYAWATPLGDYIVTDDALYNPNVGSTAGWQELAQRR